MKLVDFLVGLVVLIMGAVPFLARIEAIGNRLSFLGQPGSTTYQVILVVIGFLTIAYSLSGQKRFR